MSSNLMNKELIKKIGRKVFVLRKRRKMSRENLAHKINISQQQLFKYEMGYNRIAVDRLFGIALALNYKIDYFFPKTGIGSNHTRLFYKLQELSGEELVEKLIKSLGEED